jgi:hypothetical protein
MCLSEFKSHRPDHFSLFLIAKPVAVLDPVEDASDEERSDDSHCNCHVERVRMPPQFVRLRVRMKQFEQFRHVRVLRAGWKS